MQEPRCAVTALHVFPASRFRRLRRRIAMTVKEVLARLEALGTDKMRAQNARRGVTGEQYGVKMGDIRKVAKEIERSEEHTSELQSLMRSSYAVFCFKKKNITKTITT